MAKFNDILETNIATASGYKFSAVKLSDLSATEYTLVQITVDVSGSTSASTRDMERTIAEIVKACDRSPRRENLMIRVTIFGSTLVELHGFKLLGMIGATDYDGQLGTLGMTALYQATAEGREALAKYGGDLMEQNFLANAIEFVITDGGDTEGRVTPAAIKKIGEEMVLNEKVESFRSVLICIGNDQRVIDFGADAGFSQVEQIANATEKALAKLADFVSKSISSASQALGSQGPSQPVSFTV